MDIPTYEETVKPKILIGGLVIMVLAALLFIFIPDPNARVMTGVVILFVVGFGMTVGGSPQKRD